MSDTLGVFPRPRSVELLDGPARIEPLEVRVDPTLPPQGYRLELDDAGGRLTHSDELGLRYGRDTLTQLERTTPIRRMRISDWPTFVHRGFMLDVSRDRVPTNDTLDELVRLLAQLRITELQLYVEHTFAYADHEVVWRDASPLTPADLERLDRRCAEVGIELVANLNGFGHMERWLAHEPYRSWAECPDGYPDVFGRGERPPSALAPNQETARFAVELAREMLASVRSRRVHIGGDEPFELGMGRSAAAVERTGRDAVYLEHLRNIVEPLVADGYEPMFWADFFRRDPDMGRRVPDGATPVVWNYEAPGEQSWSQFLPPGALERLGLPDDAHEGFVAHTRVLADADAPFWIAPGTATWTTILGRLTNARGNLADAAVVGEELGAGGILITNWGDDGHWEPLAVSMPALAYGAGVTWCHATNAAVDIAPVIDELLGARSGLGERLVRLGELAEGLGAVRPNGSPLRDMVAGGGMIMGTSDPSAYADARDQVDESLAFVSSDPIGGDRGAVVNQEIAVALRMADLGLRRLGERDGHELGAARDIDVDELVADYRDAWLGSSRPGGLDDSAARIAR